MREENLLIIDTDEELAKIVQKMNRLQDQLAAPDIFRKALNAAGRKARKQVVEDAKGHYAIKNTTALRKKDEGAPEFLAATTSSLTARIRSRGPMQDIMAFMTRPNSATGAAAAKVLNSSSMKELEIGNLKAFVARFANRHVAIVQRDPPNKYSSGRSDRANKYGANADMTKLKKLLSPSVPHMLGNEEVRTKAASVTYEILQEEIEKQIRKAWASAA